ncbi:MAG: hypothetical protein GWN18_12485 [Thermoplasmata archaeon]|nr:hypothetical protein [Thermoplasmata archaeon]NIS12530.1 hypothetical protein [Thermoplasmata archaeon]NIS20776.1 hypothetical protein [Thermoplasmata archaeon]NIT78185.1 hypothetical protein [Thermoplasmata archaeon]NIU49847.1 hypothetical protein [Thermoplasmata archaeon]
MWYYRVRASGAGGDSAWSELQSVAVLPETPVLAAIENDDGDGDYLIDWDDVTEVTSYQVEEADNPEFDSAVVVYDGAASEYQVEGHLTGLWYYRVRASHAGADSPWSDPQSVSVVPDAPVLDAIDNPDGERDYLVDWNDVTGATSYELEEAEDDQFTSPTVVYYPGSPSEYQMTEHEGGLWYYRVRARNAGGASACGRTLSRWA